MKQRIVTGLFGGIVFVTLVHLGGIWYSLLVLALAVVGLYEFLRMARLKPISLAGGLSYLLMFSILSPYLFASSWLTITFSAILMPTLLILLFYSVFRKNQFHIEHVALTILGALYIGYGFHYMVSVRDGGFWLTMLILFAIASTDTGAYFVGKAYGRRKLWPAISPNKTWEGSLGGLVTALLVVLLTNQVLIWSANPGALPIWQAFGIALVTGIAAQLGDLVESAMKRHFGVKDSGRIFPGHGGVLDRFDSWLIVFPILYLFGLI